MPTFATEVALDAAKARHETARRAQQEAEIELAAAQRQLREAAIQWEREYFATRPLRG